jgi:hypothetical protein
MTILDYDPDTGGFVQPAVLFVRERDAVCYFVEERLLAESFGAVGRGILD